MSLLEGLSQAVIPDLEGAACFDMPDADAIFFPRNATSFAYREARSICGACPVRDECLEIALANENGLDRHGMFGGKTPWDRRRIQRSRDGVHKDKKPVTPCKTCERPMRAWGTLAGDYPGTVAYGVHGDCATCRTRRLRGSTIRIQRWDGSPCTSCGRAMRRAHEKAADHPGTIQHGARGKCITCYQRVTPEKEVRSYHQWDGSPCTVCNRKMRRSHEKAADHPGTISHFMHGKCRTCFEGKTAPREVTPVYRWDGSPCVDCGRKMRRAGTTLAEAPGTVIYRARGRCETCVNRKKGVKKRFVWDGSPCVDCGRKMRRAGTTIEEAPGTVVYGARGSCQPCAGQRKNKQTKTTRKATK